MNIDYKSEKHLKIFKNYVNNPEDRCFARAFKKEFGESLMTPAVRLHQRFVECENAQVYNNRYGTSDNYIETIKGGKDKEPMTLKVRIGRGPRKFFHYVNENGSPFLKKEWNGDFSLVSCIYVVDVNNHDYSNY